MIAILIILGILLYLTIGAFIGGVVAAFMEQDVMESDMASACIFLWPLALVFSVIYLIVFMFLKVSKIGATVANDLIKRKDDE